jgi:Fe-S-cluster containining protein
LNIFAARLTYGYTTEKGAGLKMGRDILHSTWLREKSLMDRKLDCEICCQRARWVQTVLRLKDVEGVTPEDRFNHKGEIFVIRLCNRHHFSAWQDGQILSDVPITEQNKDTRAKSELYLLQRKVNSDPEACRFLLEVLQGP